MAVKAGKLKKDLKHLIEECWEFIFSTLNNKSAYGKWGNSKEKTSNSLGNLMQINGWRNKNQEKEAGVIRITFCLE